MFPNILSAERYSIKYVIVKCLPRTTRPKLKEPILSVNGSILKEGDSGGKFYEILASIVSLVMTIYQEFSK